jgi:hypothetical protein
MFQRELTHGAVTAAAQHCSHVGCCSVVK